MICSIIHTPMPTPKRSATSPQGIARLRANTCLLLLAVAPSFSVSAGEDAALIAQPKITADTQGAAAPKSGSLQPAGSASVANPANNVPSVVPRLSEEAQGFNTVCLDAESRARVTTDCDLAPTHQVGRSSLAYCMDQPNSETRGRCAVWSRVGDVTKTRPNTVIHTGPRP
jgi:hypothetical protein